MKAFGITPELERSLGLLSRTITITHEEWDAAEDPFIVAFIPPMLRARAVRFDADVSSRADEISVRVLYKPRPRTKLNRLASRRHS